MKSARDVAEVLLALCRENGLSVEARIEGVEDICIIECNEIKEEYGSDGWD